MSILLPVRVAARAAGEGQALRVDLLDLVLGVEGEPPKGLEALYGRVLRDLDAALPHGLAPPRSWQD
jgi:hypothetical protein